jgi:hypothetical protein
MFLEDYELGEKFLKLKDAERTHNKIRDINRNGVLLLGRSLSHF